MSEKYKKTCKYLNYVEHLLILSLTITGCVSISAFASLVCFAVSITSSTIGIRICAIRGRIKKYKSVIKKKNKTHDKIALLGKDKLNTIEVVISKALTGSYISHDDFVSVNNALRGYNKIKKSSNFCGIHYIKMVDISGKMYEKYDKKTIVDYGGIL